MTVVALVTEPAPEPTLRRQFHLPEEDIELFDGTGLPWETVVLSEGGQQALWLFIHEEPVPEGLEARDNPAVRLAALTMGFRVTGYPGAKLDMVYIHPPLARVNHRPSGGLGDINLDSLTFQQWSRHYPFDPETNTLFTHYRTAETWLEKEAQG